MFSLIKKILFRPQSNQCNNVSFIVCGIGNKGNQYHNTRHNIGFSVIDALLHKCKEMICEKTCSSEVVIGRLPYGETVVCAKPQTYVNRSGIAVKQLVQRYGLPLSSCLVVVDDFNLPLGILRFRRRGSDGGHNGLRSIIAETGPDFPRLRIGIGPIPENTSLIDFVLSRFNEHEIEKRNIAVEKAADAIVFYRQNGIDKAMNHFNA